HALVDHGTPDVLERACSRERFGELRHDGEPLVRALCESAALFFGAPALGEIARDLREADELAGLIAKRGDDDVRPEAVAVFAETPAFVLEAALARSDLELHLALARANVFYRVKAREVMPDDLGGAIALDALRTYVPARHHTARVEHEDRVVLHALDE